MSSVITLAAQPPKLADMIRTARQHQYTLDAWAEHRRSSLLPVDVANQIRAEVMAVLVQACTSQEALRAFGRLMACYPPRSGVEQDEVDAYTAVMLEEIQRFPLPIIREALPEFSRTHAFRPSVAEVSMACQASVNRLSRFLGGLDRMERCRAEDLTRLREAEARANKTAAWVAERDALSVERFGTAGVHPGDYAGADRTFQMLSAVVGSDGLRSPWMLWLTLLPAKGEWKPWVSVPMLRAGIFGRIELSVRRGQATMTELAEIHQHLLRGDTTAARQMSDLIEMRSVDLTTAPPSSSDDPLPVPPGVGMMLPQFRELLNDPAPDAGMTPNGESAA
ncbi:MAG: hypothetical protein JWO51_163 [Rhodospirillales bacterium]|nr:hypothetical protein [Rhodospirillales bacterium]